MANEKKQVDELTFLDDIKYHPEHTWAVVDGNLLKVGITDYAQDKLGEIIFVELPQVGEEFKQGDEFGKVESAKSFSSLYMPLSGEIKTINSELEDSPELVNSNPYDEGWMVIIKPKDLSELNHLLSKDDYICNIK